MAQFKVTDASQSLIHTVVLLITYPLISSLVPDVALSVILSALSWIVHMLLWVKLTFRHLSTICLPFQVCLLHLISLQYWLSSPFVHVDCFGWCRFTFLTHFGKKRQSYWLYYHCNHSCALKWNRLKINCVKQDLPV